MAAKDLKERKVMKIWGKVAAPEEGGLQTPIKWMKGFLFEFLAFFCGRIHFQIEDRGRNGVTMAGFRDALEGVRLGVDDARGVCSLVLLNSASPAK